MAELRLAKLPDRVPVKLAISVPAELALDLRAYAAVYQAAYQSAETVEELIPFMLASFLESDKGFAKARKDVALPPEPEAPLVRRRGRRKTGTGGT